MAYFKLVLLTILVVCSIGSARSMRERGKLRYGLKYTDGNREAMTEEMVEVEVVQDLSVEERKSTEMEILRVRNDELEACLKKLEINIRRQEKVFKASLDQMEERFEFASRNKSLVDIPVSFSTYLKADFGHQVVDETIIFNCILINGQNAYDNKTGIFTAPISGVYEFSFFVVANTHGVLHAQLIVDGRVVSAGMADSQGADHAATAGNVAVLQVSKGQRVHVKCTGDTYHMLSGETVGFTSFSGYLLYVV